MDIDISTHFISVAEAFEIISSIKTKKGSLYIKRAPFDAINQILAKSVFARKDYPVMDNSAMDGFLFREADLKKGLRRFIITGEVRPEDKMVVIPQKGDCFRIMTGAPVPESDGKVIQVELVSESNGEVMVKEIPIQNPIRSRGEGFKKDDLILSERSLIRPYEAGMMKDAGISSCFIKKLIKIALQVTGSELDDQNNTNGPVINALISQWTGTEITEYPVLKDDFQTVVSALKEISTNADIVVTTGGISMGEHDYIMRAMKSLGAEVLIRKIRQKPGKPFTVSRLNNTLFFHLPGNPVAAVFCAEVYLKRFISQCLKQPTKINKVISRSEIINKRDHLTLFLHGRLVWNDGRLELVTESNMRSHLLGLYESNSVYARIEPDTHIKPGELVEIIPFTTTRLDQI